MTEGDYDEITDGGTGQAVEIDLEIDKNVVKRINIGLGTTVNGKGNDRRQR